MSVRNSISKFMRVRPPVHPRMRTRSLNPNSSCQTRPKRYYGGCEMVDVAEELAIARGKELFGAEHVNVQPHSGSQANMAVYMTLLKPGDTVLGPNLAHGG